MLVMNESGWWDLNPRPLAPEASALPSCATARDSKFYRLFSRSTQVTEGPRVPNEAIYQAEPQPIILKRHQLFTQKSPVAHAISLIRRPAGALTIYARGPVACVTADCSGPLAPGFTSQILPGELASEELLLQF